MTAPWTLRFEGYSSKSQAAEEAIGAVGNGYIATRGAPAQAAKGAYPGTYLAGGFNRALSEVGGRIIENEDLVNWPNWLPLAFSIVNPSGAATKDFEVSELKKTLLLREGVLYRSFELQDSKKRRTLIEERRFISMARKNLAAIEWKVTALNWEGRVRIVSCLDGNTVNAGVERYKSLNGRHLAFLEAGQADKDIVFLQVRSRQSRILMCQAARFRASDHAGSRAGARKPLQRENLIGQEIELECPRLQPRRVEKIVAIHTSKDLAISEPKLASIELAKSCENFDYLLNKHRLKWAGLWERFDVELKDMPRETLAIRAHIFHLLQTASHHAIDLDASVPARGLHGEAYRGHIFWDELFIFPFYSLRMPEVARSLLMYRYRRLERAKELAKNSGFSGAMYPWQSGSDGREETQKIHLNPESGRWLPDDTRLQRHVNGAIVYNIASYYNVTGDLEFISRYGAVMMLEIAKFWASAVKLNAKGRYEIWNVVGPDEFHTRYPGAKKPGLKNNAYTNFLASWCLKQALNVFKLLAPLRQKELASELELSPEELRRWEEIGRGMFIPFIDDELIAQFSGYEKLKEFDWDSAGNDASRLDRLLEARGDDVNNYKANKQADVLMLFYLFSAEELQEHFEWMGMKFDPKIIPKNIHYYLRQSSHGSTLSRITHSWVLARSDRGGSWNLFQEALWTDLLDCHHGTTGEGIHLGAMAGTIDIAQRCFSGTEVRNGVLWFNPKLPEQLKGLAFRLRFRGHPLRIELDHEQLHVCVESGKSVNKLGFNGKVFEFGAGDRFHFSLNEEAGEITPQDAGPQWQ